MRFVVNKFTAGQPIGLPRFIRLERTTGSSDYIGYQVTWWNWLVAVITKESE